MGAHLSHASRCVQVGGEREAMLNTSGRDIVYLRARRGFVRLALEAGAQLVPVFGFGNTDT